MENILEKEIQEDGANGEILVQIAPVGEFAGSDAKGNPIPENITPESLQNLADKLNSEDEILVDRDHASVKPGADKDSSAQGWLSRFIVDPLKGLFGWMKLTKRGRESVENREYRYLSPVFSLNGEGSPIDMHSVAMTNTPAFKGAIEPILNTEPKEELLKMEISKEELVSLIKETVTALNSAPEEKPVEEEKPESKADAVEEAEAPVEEAENSCGEKKDETKNEEPVEEEKKEEVEEKKEEAPVEEDKKEEVEEEKKEELKKEPEVIKAEALNSMPSASQYDVVDNAPAWKNMHGKEFFNWLQKHPKGI